MWQWDTSALDGATEPRLPTGTFVALALLWLASILATLAALLFLGIDLDRTGHSVTYTLLTAILSSVPGIVLAYGFVPAIRATYARRLGRAAAYILAMLVFALFIVLSYLFTLASSCRGLPGCSSRRRALHVLAADQFLFTLRLLGSFAAFLVCLGVWLRARSKPY